MRYRQHIFRVKNDKKKDCDGSSKSEGVFQTPALAQVANLEKETLATSLT
jgi:hypothetical protein